MSRGPPSCGSAGLFAPGGGGWGGRDLSSQAREQTCIPYIARQILNHWTTREVPIIIFKLHYHCKVFLTAFAPSHSIEKARKHDSDLKKKNTHTI